jgi:hypothetical protein
MQVLEFNASVADALKLAASTGLVDAAGCRPGDCSIE